MKAFEITSDDDTRALCECALCGSTAHDFYSTKALRDLGDGGLVLLSQLCIAVAGAHPGEPLRMGLVGTTPDKSEIPHLHCPAFLIKGQMRTICPDCFEAAAQSVGIPIGAPAKARP